MKIVFFGTSEVAVPFLKSLTQQAGVEIVGVITQPDRAAGRSKTPLPSAVAQMTTRAPVFKFPSLKKKEVVKQIASLDAELFVVVSYGNILPKSVLDLALTINVHFSLLPRHRGATPVQQTILSGDTTAGITIMQMDEALDHGAILAQEAFPIDDTIDTPRLFEMAIARAIPLLETNLRAFADGALHPIVQDESKATYTKMLTREDGQINWRNSAIDIDRQVRAFRPWPGTWTTWNGKRLKILSIRSVDKGHRLVPGTVFLENNAIFVACGHGALQILNLQLEGSKPMDAATFLRGQPNFVGSRLS